MRHLFISCLMFCACATSSPPQVIENHVPVGELPSLNTNMRAIVSVFYMFRNPDTGEVFYRQEIGVVVDATHVMARPSGWDRANIASVAITSYMPVIGEVVRGVPSYALPARIVAQTDYVAVILEVSQPLSIAPVTFANNKPNVGEPVYTISYYTHDGYFLRVWFGVVVKALRPSESRLYSHAAEDFVIKFWNRNPEKSVIFNEQHEFVGFRTHNSQPRVVSASRSAEYGHYVKSVRSLALLMRQAGIIVPGGNHAN